MKNALDTVMMGNQLLLDDKFMLYIEM